MTWVFLTRSISTIKNLVLNEDENTLAIECFLLLEEDLLEEIYVAELAEIRANKESE